MKNPVIRAIPTTSPLYIVMLGLLSALPPFGIDAGLPGLPTLQHAFAVDAAKAAQTLTIFLLGFALGPIIFGPLSDQRGRKPVLLFGVALFALAGIGCALANSLGMLFAFRALQGIGAGAAAALPSAIVRDVFVGDQGLSRQSYVALVNALAPLIAPVFGATFLALGGWRAIYAVIAILGALLCLMCAAGYRETAPLNQATSSARGGVAAAISSCKQVLSDRQYLLSTGVVACTFGTMFAYITASSSVFMTMLHASSSTFAMLFAITAAGTIGGAAVNARLCTKLGASRLSLLALLSTVVVTLLLLTIAGLRIHSILITAACVVATNFCAGIVMPNATHRALQNAGNVAGSAAALQRSLQMVVGAASGALFGMLGGDQLLAMAAAMTLFALGALGFHWASASLEAKPDGRASVVVRATKARPTH